MTQDTNHGFGRYLPLIPRQGRPHRTRRIILLAVKVFIFVFAACIPAIVIPVRRHAASHSAHLAASSTDNTTSTNPDSSAGIITIPIAPVSFTSFPVPSDTPIAGVFTEINPFNPPEATEAPGLGGVIPDFGQAWKTAKSKAKAKLATFSLEDKVALTTGVGWEGGRCVGNIPSVEDFPGLCLEASRLCLFVFRL